MKIQGMAVNHHALLSPTAKREINKNIIKLPGMDNERADEWEEWDDETLFRHLFQLYPKTNLATTSTSLEQKI